MITTVAIIQAVLFFGYTYYIYKKYGKLTSISASTYEMKGMQRWLFFAVLATVGALNFVHYEALEGWGFFAGVFLAFAGITIDHDEKGAFQSAIHSIGTIGAIVLTYIGFWVMQGIWIPIILLALSVIPIYKSKYFIWYIEIIAMAIAMLFYILI